MHDLIVKSIKPNPILTKTQNKSNPFKAPKQHIHTPKMKLYLFIATFQLGLAISCIVVAAESSTISNAGTYQIKQWCVVAPGASDQKLQAFLNTACSQLVNCKAIRPGGSCYKPDTLANHASFILNLSYRRFGQCDTAVGIFSIDDPSFGRCQYP
ncbi:hypothetical protein SASPL_112910 [Salvia splendens]|uniref:X8 domain-containing protein n=1 Tax=Salvia splendens TaxID=180675 RepID=A0A8X9A3Q7_SALSN|nr:hypothetical protein SASPL_112910 [Salvia splendens]